MQQGQSLEGETLPLLYSCGVLVSYPPKMKMTAVMEPRMKPAGENTSLRMVSMSPRPKLITNRARTMRAAMGMKVSMR